MHTPTCRASTPRLTGSVARHRETSLGAFTDEHIEFATLYTMMDYFKQHKVFPIPESDSPCPICGESFICVGLMGPGHSYRNLSWHRATCGHQICGDCWYQFVEGGLFECPRCEDTCGDFDFSVRRVGGPALGSTQRPVACSIRVPLLSPEARLKLSFPAQHRSR